VAGRWGKKQVMMLLESSPFHIHLGCFASAMLKCSSAGGGGFGETPPTGSSHNKNAPPFRTSKPHLCGPPSEPMSQGEVVALLLWSDRPSKAHKSHILAGWPEVPLLMAA